jgi:NADPH:quinone reductase-like Zn-dependent oxidoreductase
MKAIRVHDRGGAERLAYEDAPTPTPLPGEARVRVVAAGVTPGELDWPATYEDRTGADRLPSILGHEFAGIVDAVGPDTAGAKIGDAVFALSDFWRDGAYAEYTVIVASDLAPMPSTIDFITAAAAPLSALTAWQALFDHANLGAGQAVLIHGAAGGVGSLAVQLAHWRGARVLGTASADDLKFIRGLGADETIDYVATRFEDVARDVDVVLDLVGGETLDRSWGVVKRGGVIVTTIGEISQARAAETGVRGVSFIVAPSRRELGEIAGCIDRGTLWPEVARLLPLARAREGFEGGARGRSRGKTVLSVQRP